MQGGRWLNAAAVITWIVCGLPQVVAIAQGSFQSWPAAAWLGAFVLYGVALVGLIRTPYLFTPRAGAVPLLLLAVQSVTGVTMMLLAATYAGGTGAISATLVIVAAELPHFVPPAVAWSWVAVQTAVLVATFYRGDTLAEVLGFALALGGFQLFATASSFLTRSEMAARATLARANAELLATRALLAETSRVEERLRISRDLHDTIGHHLTALSLQLEVASRLSSGKAAEHLMQAHAIAKLLLSDVRDVVGRLRDSAGPNLTEAIRGLAATSTGFAIHISMPGALGLDDAARAQALVRSVQEIITNTTRHANARNLWITLQPRSGGVELIARDDGDGADHLACGNGLNGMRERFEEHAGRVDFETHAGAGFSVRAFMPGPHALDPSS